MNAARCLAVLSVSVITCGCSAMATFVDRTSGTAYQGRSIGSVYSSEGQLVASIDGENYSGSWVYMSGDGNITLGTGTAIASNGAAAFGNFTGIGLSTKGNGVVNMKGDAGSVLRCVYNWSEMSSSGIGECERNDGRRYDLRLKLK